MGNDSLEEIAYNNLCWDIGYLNGDAKKFNVNMFLASIISIVGTNIATTINDFEDDWVTRTIKMIPLLLMIRQTYNLGKDVRQLQESKRYLQLLCKKLEEKEIHINLKDFKKAVFKPSTFNRTCFLQDILLGNEMILTFDKTGEIKYVDNQKSVEITDEVAECCLGESDLLDYKKNKMRK